MKNAISGREATTPDFHPRGPDSIPYTGDFSFLIKGLGRFSKKNFRQIVAGNSNSDQFHDFV